MEATSSESVKPGPKLQLPPRPAGTADGEPASIREHLLAALQEISARLLRNPEERVDLEEAAGLVQRALGLIDASGSRSDKTAISEASLQVFAKLLREKREAARLSREKLAERARVSVATIRGIEKAQHRPSRTTLVRLLSVPELRMQAGEAKAAEPQNFLPHSWFAPQYDPMGMMVDMIETLNGPGGHLEQTYQYLDGQSAIHWLSLCNAEQYAAAYRVSMPLEKVAERIVKLAGKLGLDVNALGCGDGKQEVRLVQHLTDLMVRPGQVRLHLLDISHTLLSTALRHAQSVLASRSVPIYLLHGNFHDLPQYRQLHQQLDSERRCRVFTLFGNTLANLDNEIRYFRDTLVGCVPGDLFLLDLAVAHAPTDQPDLIRKSEPAFAGLNTLYQQWLAGPIRRYCPGVVDVKLSVELDTHCPVPGSYELLVCARVTMANREERRFTTWRVRKYDPQQLSACLQELGWETLFTQSYGPTGSRPAMLLLLRRRPGEAEE